jgi:hypothetical protein
MKPVKFKNGSIEMGREHAFRPRRILSAREQRRAGPA